MEFVPKLFIGIGATNAFYTLRETYLYETYVGMRLVREVRSFHHFNLSQDIDEAIAKAKVDSASMGLAFEPDREKLAQEMREIKRATAEQLAARAVAAEAEQARWLELRAKWRAEQEQGIRDGVVTFGRYRDWKIAELPRDYLTWLAKKLPEFEEGSLIRLLAEVVRDQYSARLLPEPDADLTVGAPGERLELDVEVLRNYPVQSDFGTLYIVTMVTTERVCVVSKSSAFCPTVGEHLRIKATVKKHDNYKGQAQTQIQRVKILEKVAA